MNRPQQLMSLPPRMAEQLAALDPQFAADWFVTHDPLGAKLGSGGGTAHLLIAAWQATGQGQSLTAWLRGSRKLMLHAGGQSRRLPAYAACGKAFIPIPVMRWATGQRLDQTLVDLQLPLYQRLCRQAGPNFVAMVTAGDVLLRSQGALPAFPEVDVLVFGLWVAPAQARHHGVFFCPRGQPDQLDFVRQKPALAEIGELSNTHLFMIDTGIWLLSERAVVALLAKCGWRAPGDPIQPYELYAELGLGLGARPTRVDPALAGLTSAVLPLPQGEFYHFGANQHLIDSVTALQNLVVDQRQVALAGAKPHPSQHTQNAIIEPTLTAAQHTLWIENSFIPATWNLASEHVLTGVPRNDWSLDLEPGVCLDFVPLGADRLAVRPYAITAEFRGPVSRSHGDWFAARGLTFAGAGIDPATDTQDAPLFAALPAADLTGDWVQWLIATRPANRPDFAARWLAAERLSATDLAARAELPRLVAQRRAYTAAVLLPLARNHARSVFYQLDLAATARLYAATDQPLPPELPATAASDPLKRAADFMFRATALRGRGQADWEQPETSAFALLRELIVDSLATRGVEPRLTAQEDQIVWGRSPVRLDLAGGWTDTPPYCLRHGGQVLNVAVDLNGQPPIQVFARRCETPELVVRSIDLGIEERIRTFAELERYNVVGSGFTVARAAFALCGFLPRFRAGRPFATLAEQLREFGGGIEVSLLCAAPKGSGLGTSSILSATLLGTLGELCGLKWDSHELFQRTLGLEQMLTTGGGWQDQAGGLLRGMKLISTAPGLDQTPTVRWLPGQFFGADHADRTVLLYYTGITRVAKEILKEIVRGMFLNARGHLELLADIGANAATATDAIQRADWAGLCGAVRASWELNQQLDAGTNPPAVRAILDRVSDQLAAAKLLGAGGGGYLLMFAKDRDAAERVRRELTGNPPNAKARFVSLRLSETGFQVTRS